MGGHRHDHHAPRAESLAERLAAASLCGPQPSLLGRAVARARGWLWPKDAADPDVLPALPVALRRGELASAYLAADRVGDHRRAAVAASTAADRAADGSEWGVADIWLHRALWHFEQADLSLHATRAARRIGELRIAAGEPRAARRYFAEAISEARDLGAEREEGLAALGMGRAELEMGNVTTARRMAGIASDLLARCAAPASEIEAARTLRGEEKQVGGERSEART